MLRFDSWRTHISFINRRVTGRFKKNSIFLPWYKRSFFMTFVCCAMDTAYIYLVLAWRSHNRFTWKLFRVCTNLNVMYTYYKVSGGPIIKTSHRNMSFSSINPAENPSIGFLFNSANCFFTSSDVVRNSNFCDQFLHLLEMSLFKNDYRTRHWVYF